MHVKTDTASMFVYAFSIAMAMLSSGLQVACVHVLCPQLHQLATHASYAA